MSVPSLISDSSSVSNVNNASPSKLAANAKLFDEWMLLAKATDAAVAPQHVLSQFDDLYKLDALPIALQGTLPFPIHFFQDEFQRTVQQWAATLPNTEEDKYNIVPLMQTFALAYHRIRETSNGLTKEHGRCRGVDDILQLAFRRLGSKCDFKKEERYRLVQLDSSPNAQSDTMISIPYPHLKDSFRAQQLSCVDPTLVNELYWCANGSRDKFSIIVLPGEFRKDDAATNMNQLIMVLITAQSQRKALGLKNSVIMGATACRGIVLVFSSFWGSPDESSVWIYQHEQEFDLTKPTDFIHLYIFFAKLRDSFEETLISQLQQLPFPGEANIKRFRWRSADPVHTPHHKRTVSSSASELRSNRSGRNRSGGGSSSHKGSGDGGGNGTGDGNGNDGPNGGNGYGDGDGRNPKRARLNHDGVEVKGQTRDDPDDWHSQINEWKAEAVEGAKEATLISGKGKMLTESSLRRLRHGTCAPICCVGF